MMESESEPTAAQISALASELLRIHAEIDRLLALFEVMKPGLEAEAATTAEAH